MNKLLITISAIVIIVAGALIGAPAANAASQFDNTVQIMDSAITLGNYSTNINNFDESNSVDLTNEYISLMTTDDNNEIPQKLKDLGINSYHTASSICSFDVNTAENWAVIAMNDRVGSSGTNINNSITIIWTTTENTSANFVDKGSYQTLEVDPSFGCSIGISSVNTLYVSTYNSSTMLANSLGSIKPYFINWEIDYPVDYEGELIPDTYIPPIQDVDVPYAPRWTYDVKDWLVTFSDMNFLTFDPVPFTCDGLTPLLNFEIKDAADTEVLASGQVGASAQMTWQAPKMATDQEFILIGWYSDCQSGNDNAVFIEQGRRHIYISPAGLYATGDIFDICFDSNIPYLKFNDCVQYIVDLGSLLAFGQPGNVLGSEWRYLEQCRQLVVLDDWLNLDNPTVCAQFSTEVRQVVTPFVSVFLGLIIVGFIAGKYRKE